MPSLSLLPTRSRTGQERQSRDVYVVKLNNSRGIGVKRLYHAFGVKKSIIDVEPLFMFIEWCAFYNWIARHCYSLFARNRSKRLRQTFNTL